MPWGQPGLWLVKPVELTQMSASLGWPRIMDAPLPLLWGTMVWGHSQAWAWTAASPVILRSWAGYFSQFPSEMWP